MARVSFPSVLSTAVVVCSLIGTVAFAQQDTDGDGLLDLLDVEEFDPSRWYYACWAENRVCDIEDLDGASQLTNATRISLFGNQITSIERGDFEGLANLQELLLGWNQITHLEEGAFAGLANLRHLELNDNQITSLTAGVFSDLANLQTLELGSWSDGGNPIREVEDGAFEGLELLKTLTIDFYTQNEMNLRGAELPSLEWMDGAWPLTVRTLFLDDAVLSSVSFSAILEYPANKLTKVSLVGLTFADSGPNDMGNLLKHRLRDLTIDTDLYHLYQDEFDAFAAIDGKTLTVVDPDCNGDGVLDILDANCTSGRRIKYFLEDYGTVPGDADGMGGVEFADFLILNDNFGRSPAVYTDGDFDMDGEVGFSDFLVLSGNYGQGGDFATKVAAVPEPSSSLIMIFASLFLFRSRLAHRRTLFGGNIFFRLRW